MDGLMKIMAIGIGGAFGAIARHLVNLSPLAASFEKFPLPTLVVNVSGSFLIGLMMIILADRVDVDENIRLAVIVGFIGAFTTFSTLEMELYGLMRERLFGPAALYLILSISLGFAALLAGIAIGRKA